MNLTDMTSELKSMNDRMRKEGSNLFSQYFAPLFIQFPNLESFSFTQYAPFFNDGDVCHFSVNTYSLKINDYNSDYNDDEIPEPENYLNISAAIEEKINEIDDSFYENAFGSDQKLTFYRDGRVKNEEYGEHD